MLHAVIMAGGGGTRFWPRSRARRPKQFLALTGERTLLQQAFDRLEAVVPQENTWVITGQQHANEVAKQLPALPREHIVGEPCGRDTAPCIALGAALIAQQDAEGIMVVTPADHLIEPAVSFQRTIQVAVQMAQELPSALVTIGIPPTFPSTAYGYMQLGPELATRNGLVVYRVQRFREKPRADLAEQFVASGDHFWNAGIFTWRVQAILRVLAEQQPAIHTAVRRIAAAWPTSHREEVFCAEYPALSKISIDYAVMEQAPEVLVVQAPFHWDDVGSWLALERIHPPDAYGNTVLAQHVGAETHQCIVVGDHDHLVATVGVHNLLIVQDGQVVLVADKNQESALKALVEQLGQQGWEKFL